MQECKAKEYGDCTSWGIKEVDVLFLYRDNSGNKIPDETVKVCMCEAHRNVLEKHNEGRPLEMRGEKMEWALHDDLFYIFQNKKNTYTCVKVEMKSSNEFGGIFYFKGRDIEMFRAYIHKTNPDIKYIREEGIFIISLALKKGEKEVFEEQVIEMKPIKYENDMYILSSNLVYYAEAEYSADAQVDASGLEYTIEPARECVQTYFAQKLEDYNREQFDDCLYFMNNEINRGLIDTETLRENSEYSKDELYSLVRRLTIGLQGDPVSPQLTSGGLGDCPLHTSGGLGDCPLHTSVGLGDCPLLTGGGLGACPLHTSGGLGNCPLLTGGGLGACPQEVLWITYIMANHKHFRSNIPGRDLRQNIPLINMFIKAGLHGRLLLLAISGERERTLDIHRYSHDNILCENIYVVRYLVPRYFNASSLIELNKIPGFEPVTPYSYYNDFSNLMFNCNPGVNEEPFEKNKEILLYLLKCLVETLCLHGANSGYEKTEKKYRLKYESLLAEINTEKEMYDPEYLKKMEKKEAKWLKALENYYEFEQAEQGQAEQGQKQAEQKLTYYNIWITPIFIKEGSNYTFEGLNEDEQEDRGRNYEFRFILDTLRYYFGDDLDFEETGNQIKISTLTSTEMLILAQIHQDTYEFPIKYGRSQMTFEINGYQIG